MQKIKWNIHEAVILLEGYIDFINGKFSRPQIIKLISENLRTMAVNNGLEIDDTYRNINGITNQLKSMESAYNGYQIREKARNLFIDVVKLYCNDKAKYNILLEEARAMIDVKQLDFNNIPDMSSTKPVKFIYNSITKDCTSWIKLYSDLISLLRIIYQDTLTENLNFIVSSKNIDSLIKPVNIGGNLFIEGNLSANDITKRIKIFLDICKVDYSNIVIYYQHRKINIIPILEANYNYGLKYDSIIELTRFRNFAREKNISLPDNDDDLRNLILSLCAEIGDRAYYISKKLSHKLNNLVNNIFSSGHEVIYYECLMTHYENFMNANFITSQDLLRNFLQKCADNYYFTDKFICTIENLTEREAVTNEIIRSFGHSQTLKINELSEKLPFIPVEIIKRVISGNNYFVLNSKSDEEYLFIDNLIINDDPQKFLDFAESACNKNGFVPINDLPVENIEEENYTLSHITICNAVYKKFLAHKFSLNSKIITKNLNSALDPVIILKQYLKPLETCKFSDLSLKTQELTGTLNRNYTFRALYDVMIRLDRDNFICDEAVNFDVDSIDNILSGIIRKNFIAVRDITSFAMFPYCNQRWTLYLLESFCYRFSRKFDLRVQNFNDKNIGVIAEKNFIIGYDEILSMALARSYSDLNETGAGNYLFENGYTGRKIFSGIQEIIKRAKILRERS